MSGEENTPKSTSKFPYKTLIWAAFALIAIFLFKKEISGLLSSASEIAVFGIELKVNKQQAAKLEIAIQGYKDKINEFTEQVNTQQEQIQSLEGLKEKLEEDIANCPEATETANILDLQFKDIMQSNKELKINSDVLKDTRIIVRLDKGQLKERQ